MKPLLSILAVCLAICLQAAESPIIRNPFSTNYPPVNVAINGQTNLGVFYFPPIMPSSVSDQYPVSVVQAPFPGGQGLVYSHQTLGASSSTFNVPVLTTSASSNAPANNELATGGFVRGLLAGQGIELFATTNFATFGTNVGTGQRLYTFATTVPSPAVVQFLGVTNNEYMGSTVTTNTFQAISGPIVGNTYIFFPSGGGRTLTMHEEIYFSYDRTNWFGDYETANQTITPGVTNLYQFAIAFPSYTSTNASGFYIQKRRKVGTQNANPDVTIWVGTNTPSHMDLAGPNTFVGNAFLGANQTFTAANTFTGQTTEKSIFKTPTYVTSSVGATSFVGTFGQDETVCELNTNALSILSSTNRATNIVAFANWTIHNYCGSNATISLSASWRPLGSCTNSLTLTNAKVLRLSVGFPGRAVAGWDSETNVFYGYAFQP